MADKCLNCDRPLWDGGHALSPRECEGLGRDERCHLLGAIRRMAQRLERDLEHAPRDRDYVDDKNRYSLISSADRYTQQIADELWEIWERGQRE